MDNKTLYLQRMMKSHKRRANVFAIAGSKRGVGKTNVAANLAGWFLNTRVYDAGMLVRDERFSAALRLRKPVVLACPKIAYYLIAGGVSSEID